MANPPERTLGETVREARLRAGLTLREVARRLEITPSYMSDIENDRRIPSQEVLEKIAAILELDPADLMALAGRLGDAVERYIRRTPAAGILFRRISQANLQGDALRRLIEETERLERGEAD